MQDPFFYRLLQKASLRNETRVKPGFGEMAEEEDRFEVGEFVFAKLKGYMHWPATISQIETHYAHGTSGHEKIKYNVYFYGSHEMCMLKWDSILRFQEHCELFKKKYASNPKFTAALKELEADKGTREEYVKSLQECMEDSSRYNAPQEKPNDEMFSCPETSDNENRFTSANTHSPTSSSGFGDGFDSDEEYQALRNQKYEILSMEKVPYLDSNNFILVISLGFKEEDLLEDYREIREEIRMMTCFVKLERVNPILNAHQLEGPQQEDIDSRVLRKIQRKPLLYEEPLDWLEEEGLGSKQRRRRKWRKKWTRTKAKPSLTVLAAEAVKRRRRPRKKKFRDETRVLSLRHKTDDAAEKKPANTQDTKTCCSAAKCSCVADSKPTVITCPICQAQFSSSVDYKQHSFNIHIMGL